MDNLSIKFELPGTVVSLAGLSAKTINTDVKKMFAMFLYEHKKISLSKTCEIGGMSQWDFYELNKQLGISIPYTEEDLAKDKEKLADV